MTTKKLIVILFILCIHAHSQTPYFEWIKSCGGTGYDISTSVITDKKGNAYTIGKFENTVDFDPDAGTLNLTSVGSSDIYISKLSSEGTLLWVKQIGGIGMDIGYSITLDSINNIYVTGTFYNTVDFDPSSNTYNLTSNGGSDIFVMKLDSSANFKWAKSFGSNDVSYNDNGFSIAVDKAGAVYTTGNFSETTDFDPGSNIFNLYAQCHTDIFISKMDSSGKFIWAKQMGGLADAGDAGYSLVLDNFANIYSTGYFNGTSDFNPGIGTFTLSAGTLNSPNVYISKLDSSGNFVWAKQLESPGYGIAKAISLDKFNNVYTTGSFKGTMDFDTGTGIYNLNSGVSSSCFISKIDPSGNFIWAKQIGGNHYFSDTEGKSIKTDTNGNVYIAGNFKDSVDINLATPSYLVSDGFTDAFIAQLSPSGNIQWAKKIGGVDFDEANSISIDSSGNVYTAGNFQTVAYFDNNTSISSMTSAGSSDIFLDKLSHVISNGFIHKNIEEGVFVYPNPSNGITEISTPNQLYKDLKIKIYNSTGVLVYESIYNGNSQTINLSKYSNGIYFLKIFSENTIICTKKIIKE